MEVSLVEGFDLSSTHDWLRKSGRQRMATYLRAGRRAASHLRTSLVRAAAGRRAGWVGHSGHEMVYKRPPPSSTSGHLML